MMRIFFSFFLCCGILWASEEEKLRKWNTYTDQLLTEHEVRMGHDYEIVKHPLAIFEKSDQADWESQAVKNAAVSSASPGYDISVPNHPKKKRFSDYFTGLVYRSLLLEVRPSSRKKPTQGLVLLQHGFLDSSDTWVLSRYGLAYHLADLGFRVFLGNSRGNKYSMQYMDVDCMFEKRRCDLIRPNWILADKSTLVHRFWEFSWDEMAYDDQPAFFNYILREYSDEGKSIHYVGHSQGTTQMFAALSAKWINAGQLAKFVALAPIMFVNAQSLRILKSAARLVAHETIDLSSVSSLLGEAVHPESFKIAELPRFDTRWETYPVNNRDLMRKLEAMKYDPASQISGFSYYEADYEMIQYQGRYFPSGTNVHNLLHWAQSVAASDDDAFSPRLPFQIVKTKKTTIQNFLALISSGLSFLAAVADPSLDQMFKEDELARKIEDIESDGNKVAHPDGYNYRYLMKNRERNVKIRNRWKYFIFPAFEGRETEFIEREPGIFKHPLYNTENLAQVVNKVHFFFGGYDMLGTVEGVEKLKELIQIPPSRLYFFPTYDHGSFTGGINIQTEVNTLIEAIFTNSKKVKKALKFLKRASEKWAVITDLIKDDRIDYTRIEEFVYAEKENYIRTVSAFRKQTFPEHSQQLYVGQIVPAWKEYISNKFSPVNLQTDLPDQILREYKNNFLWTPIRRSDGKDIYQRIAPMSQTPALEEDINALLEEDLD